MYGALHGGKAHIGKPHAEYMVMMFSPSYHDGWSEGLELAWFAHIRTVDVKMRFFGTDVCSFHLNLGPRSVTHCHGSI